MYTNVSKKPRFGPWRDKSKLLIDAIMRRRDDASYRSSQFLENPMHLMRPWFLTLVLIVALSLAAWQPCSSGEKVKPAGQQENTQHLAATLTLEKGQAICEEGHVGRGLFWIARSL